MIDLYTSPTPNGWKVSILLEELGLPYNVCPIRLQEGEQKEPWYLKLLPHLQRWIEAIAARPAAQHGVAVPGEIDPDAQRQWIEKFRAGQA